MREIIKITKSKCQLKFVNGLTLELEKIPAYSALKGEWIEPSNPVLNNYILEEDIPIESKTSFINSVVSKTVKKGEDYINRIGYNARTANLARRYSDNNASLTPHLKLIKNTIFKFYNGFDIDMIKGHPTILVEIAKSNDIALDGVEFYIDNFKQIAFELSEYYTPDSAYCDDKITFADIKYLFNLTIYGGGLSTWVKSIQEGNAKKGIPPRNVAIQPPHKYYTDFKNDIDEFKKLLIEKNPALLKTVSKPEDQLWKNENRFMSYYCQIIENDCVYTAYNALLDKCPAFKRRVAWAYDGFTTFAPLPPEITMPDLIDYINNAVFTKSGLSIKFTHKEFSFDTIYENALEKIENNPNGVSKEQGEESKDTNVYDLNCELIEVSSYEHFKLVFEKTHFVVINQSLFMKEVKDHFGDIKLTPFTKEALKTSYGNIIVKKTTIKPSGEIVVKDLVCVNEWIKDIHRRSYDNVECLPPPLRCPPRIFNTWTPFRFETLNVFERNCEGKIIVEPDDKEDLDLKLNFFLDHIKVLSNHSDEIYAFLTYWIGYIMKYPAERKGNSMPVLIGAEGSGKTSLIEFFKKAFGLNKVLSSSYPELEVWGTFNELLKNKYLVYLEELTLKQFANAESMYKTLITGTTLTINEKGVKKTTQNNYLRLISTTNHSCPMKTEVGDRRSCITRISDEKLGDCGYFDYYYDKILADDKAVCYIAEHFINLPDLHLFSSKKIPCSEHQQAIQQSNRDYADLFVENLTSTHKDKSEVSFTNAELYNQFKTFCSLNGLEFTINAIKFGMKLGTLKLPAESITNERTTSKKSKKFNIDLLKKHYGIGCLININKSQTKDKESESDTDTEDLYKQQSC